MKRHSSVHAAAFTAALLAPIVSVPATASAAPNYAAEVIRYSPGIGFSPGYDQPSSTLGEPSRTTPGPFGGDVDPFSGPWQPSQLASIGAGGSLTVRFQYPVFNLPGNPFGLDFLVFGGTAFLITNGDFSGGGITDGSLFGTATGPIQISVSADGSLFYALDPARTPKVDGFFPTDGSGDFSLAVNPGLNSASFEGLALDGIRNLYNGSGGGTGFDIAWARNPDGSPATLDSIQFVRIDVLGDRAEIDAFSAVPEPSAVVLTGLGVLTLLPSRRTFARNRNP